MSDIPNQADCPGCAKVRRHPGEGYSCSWHPEPTGAAPIPVIDVEFGKPFTVPEEPGMYMLRINGVPATFHERQTLQQAVVDRVVADLRACRHEHPVGFDGHCGCRCGYCSAFLMYRAWERLEKDEHSQRVPGMEEGALPHEGRGARSEVLAESRDAHVIEQGEIDVEPTITVNESS